MGLVRVERGQLVLVAAAVVAVALVPLLLAYLQLGYHPDVADGRPAVAGAEPVEFLDRSVHDAAAETAGEYEWTERAAMADAVRVELGEDTETLELTRLEEGLSYAVSYNRTAAADWRADNCDRGEGRRFGSCETDGGIVLQERADEAVLLAVAFDIESVGPEGTAEVTVVVVVGG
jgi:hypothetical protein